MTQQAKPLGKSSMIAHEASKPHNTRPTTADWMSSMQLDVFVYVLSKLPENRLDVAACCIPRQHGVPRETADLSTEPCKLHIHGLPNAQAAGAGNDTGQATTPLSSRRRGGVKSEPPAAKAVCSSSNHSKIKIQNSFSA